MRKRFAKIALGLVLLLLLPIPVLAQSDILLPDGIEQNPLPETEARMVVFLVFGGLVVVAGILLAVAVAKMRRFQSNEETKNWIKKEIQEEITETIKFGGEKDA